jgi:hypothetical protein
VITSQRGGLKGIRIIPGRKAECMRYDQQQKAPSPDAYCLSADPGADSAALAAGGPDSAISCAAHECIVPCRMTVLS